MDFKKTETVILVNYQINAEFIFKATRACWPVVRLWEIHKSDGPLRLGDGPQLSLFVLNLSRSNDLKLINIKSQNLTILFLLVQIFCANFSWSDLIGSSWWKLEWIFGFFIICTVIRRHCWRSPLQVTVLKLSLFALILSRSIYLVLINYKFQILNFPHHKFSTSLWLVQMFCAHFS